MSVTVFEELFNSAILEVVVPDTTVQFPDQSAPDEWLETANSQKVDRKQAFFDEQLQSLLLIRISNPDSSPYALVDRSNPPPALISFLSHLQISLEATYISPHPASLSSPPLGRNPFAKTTLAAPPRSDSVGRVKARLNPQNPSIFPPATPNPTPSTAETDRKYVQAEGTLLLASIWGQGQSSTEQSAEKFTLLWSEKDQVWVAVYRLALTVSFLRLTTSEPLLCLTVSATLRDKRLPATTQPNHPFLQFLNSLSDLPSLAVSPISPSSQSPSQFHSPTATTPTTPIPTFQTINTTDDHPVAGLEEVNLLSGLASGPNFPSSGDGGVYVPSTRLGDSIRHSAFSLPSASNLGKGVSPQAQTPTSGRTTTPASHPTLRKSFRKTLRTVSGFRVRMRTVFVPYVLLHGEGPEDDEERERREAGNEERTVVLCVEVENSGESGSDVGFSVESVDVNIGGEGARAVLIGWGDRRDMKGGEGLFPLQIGSMEQYNLLYAVSFLQNPDDVDGFSLVGGADDQRTGKDREKEPELKRAVTIHINGKPFVHGGTEDGAQGRDTEGREGGEKEKESVSYPTQSFSSRWNCILDLSPQSHRSPGPSTYDIHPYPHPQTQAQIKDALPEPPSPFPMSQSKSQTHFQSRSPHTATASSFAQAQERSLVESKRNTIPGQVASARTAKSAGATRLSLTPYQNRASSPKISHTPPAIAVQSQTQYSGSPTTYGPPLSADGTPMSSFGYDSPGPLDSAQTAQSAQYASGLPPLTPAYPAYPSRSSTSPAPHSHVPISSLQSGAVGPSVEIRRGMGLGGVGQSPTPMVVGTERGMGVGPVVAEEEGEPIVVSVGLLSSLSANSKEGTRTKIYPLHTFTLDIFVFNQSSWTRRFEVSYPDRRRRRKQDDLVGGVSGAGSRIGATGNVSRKDVPRGLGDGNKPGILPLENRVRIGPLRPSTCQSVRMDFLAVTPGVHRIDTLRLTDVVSGYAMNLRSVMDVVVHEPQEE